MEESDYKENQIDEQNLQNEILFNSQVRKIDILKLDEVNRINSFLNLKQNLFAFGNQKKSIILLDIKNKKHFHEINCHNGWAISFEKIQINDDLYLISGGDYQDKSIFCTQIEQDGEQMFINSKSFLINKMRGSVNCLKFLPEMSQLLSGSTGGELKCFKFKKQEQKQREQNGIIFYLEFSIQFDSQIYQIINKQNNFLLGFKSGEVKVYSNQKKSQVKQIKRFECSQNIWKMKVLENVQNLVFISYLYQRYEKNKVEIYNFFTGQNLFQFQQNILFFDFIDLNLKNDKIVVENYTDQNFQQYLSKVNFCFLDLDKKLFKIQNLQSNFLQFKHEFFDYSQIYNHWEPYNFIQIDQNPKNLNQILIYLLDFQNHRTFLQNLLIISTFQ